MTITITSKGAVEMHFFDPMLIDQIHRLFDDRTIKTLLLELKGSDEKGQPSSLLVQRTNNRRIVQVNDYVGLSGDEAEAFLASLAADAQRELAAKPN